MNLGKILLLAVVIILVAAGLFVYSSRNLNKINPSENKTGSVKQTTTGKLNLIIVDICTLRSDHLSFNGYPVKTTPNLDEFTKEATVFDNFWTESGWCLPNFATLLTGTRAPVHQLSLDKESKLPEGIKTLPGLLQDLGYQTAGFSGSKYLTAGYGLTGGFDKFENKFKPGQIMFAASLEENLADIKNWLSQRASQQPFFLYVTVDDLHSPYHVDDPGDVLPSPVANVKFGRAYNGERFDEPPGNGLSEAAAAFKKDPQNMINLVKRYDKSLQRTDRLVGELLNMIRSNNLFDNSLIIITGHQGEQFGEHGLLGHTEGIYEPILRVPIIIRHPKYAGMYGQRLGQLVERIDIPATLMNEAGNPPLPGQFVGTSLVTLLENPDAEGKKYIFAASNPVRKTGENRDIEERAVKNKQYKLLWYKYKTNQYELYDLKNDPKEQVNLINKLPKVFQELKDQLGIEK